MAWGWSLVFFCTSSFTRARAMRSKVTANKEIRGGVTWNSPLFLGRIRQLETNVNDPDLDITGGQAMKLWSGLVRAAINLTWGDRVIKLACGEIHFGNRAINLAELTLQSISRRPTVHPSETSKVQADFNPQASKNYHYHLRPLTPRQQRWVIRCRWSNQATSRLGHVRIFRPRVRG